MSSPVTPLTPAQVEHQKEYDLHRSWFNRVLVALDILCNVVFLNGHLDETISSHAARAALEGKKWGVVVCRILNKVIEPNHGGLAIGADAGDAEIVEDIEKKSGGLG